MAEYIDRKALEKAMTIAAANGKDKDRRTWAKAICVLHDILALSTAMSSVGINAEAGGTAMTQTMTAISKAVSAGGDDLETFAKIAGVSASEFADMWGNEPIDAISAFIGGLGKMNENGEDTISVLDELGLSGIRQSILILIITQRQQQELQR